MSKILYTLKRFSEKNMAVITTANDIIEEYEAQGYSLTLRQLYYQFVSRDLIPNQMSEYKRLGSIINDARLAGLIDWKAIEDRTRNIQANSHWDGPGEIVEACLDQYQVDKWETQPCRVEVWIEKDALIGVIERVCQKMDVTFFSCRGYTSQSEMWVAGQRLKEYALAGQPPVILHLGDHDPSGIDMTRDIRDRLELFMEGEGIQVKRIALNQDQIEKYNPPPNPTKITDSRAAAYMRQYGDKSWELDALEPSVIENLIDKQITVLRDDEAWDEMVALENEHKDALLEVVKEMKA